MFSPTIQTLRTRWLPWLCTSRRTWSAWAGDSDDEDDVGEDKDDDYNIIISWDYCQPRQDRAGPLLQLVHCHPAREPRPEHGAGEQQHFLPFFIF